MEQITIKALKVGTGEWAVFYGTGKATKLAYSRWFKTEQVAQKWADKFAKSYHDPKWKRQSKLKTI